jgi:hypothetical protein
MSRSFKHVPGWTDRSPWAKKMANKRVRKMNEVPNGKSYKKAYESWDIHDYKTLLFTKMDEEFITRWQPIYKAKMK